MNDRHLGICAEDGGSADLCIVKRRDNPRGH